jgi:hypothetical protein
MPFTPALRLALPLAAAVLLALALPGAAPAKGGRGPRRLPHYADVIGALTEGRTVKVVIRYAKCKLVVDGKEEEAPDATGGMEVATWEQFAKGVVRNDRAYLSTSHTVLIGHPRYGHVLNYVRLRLYDDDRAEITARYLKPDTHEVVMDETFTGRLSDGKDQNGVNCFVKE